MPLYEHRCRECSLEWLEEYSLEDFEKNAELTCPECESEDTFRCVTTSACIHFKGSGWSPDGYSKENPLGTWGNQLKVYDRKEDHDREAAGQERVRVKKRMKKQNEAIKKTMGVDATIGEAEAERKMSAAVDKKLGRKREV